jgi:Phosphodiester glycosidase
MKRGQADATDVWTVDLGFYASQAAAQDTVNHLATAGITTRFDASAGVRADDLRPVGHGSSMCWLLTRAQADIHLSLPNGNTLGATDLGGTGEKPSVAAQRTGALAAVNGGFFTNVNPFGLPLPPRSPVGAVYIGGELRSPALGGRPAIMVGNDAAGRLQAALLKNLDSRITLSDGHGNSIPIRSINRPILGLAVDCGNPAETPSSLPQQDYTCKSPNDLVLYDGRYLKGTTSNNRVDTAFVGTAYQVPVTAAGVAQPGGTAVGAAPPAGGYVLQGLGTSAQWLRDHAAPGSSLTITKQLLAAGNELRPAPGQFVLEAGPTLVDAQTHASNVLVTSAAEGFAATFAGNNTSAWYNGWMIARNGRTAIGIAADGTVLLVEIDGRQPGLSLGTSIPETAAVMAWLGSTRAMNLDGGGSSNMVVDGASVGHPSDGSGERGTGDNLLVVAK